MQITTTILKVFSLAPTNQIFNRFQVFIVTTYKTLHSNDNSVFECVGDAAHVALYNKNNTPFEATLTFSSEKEGVVVDMHV